VKLRGYVGSESEGVMDEQSGESKEKEMMDEGIGG